PGLAPVLDSRRERHGCHDVRGALARNVSAAAQFRNCGPPAAAAPWPHSDNRPPAPPRGSNAAMATVAATSLAMRESPRARAAPSAKQATLEIPTYKTGVETWHSQNGVPF